MVVTDPVGGAHLAAIFGRLWDGRAALTLGFAEADVARMRELAAKNRAGGLTPAEAPNWTTSCRPGICWRRCRPKPGCG